MLLCYLHLSIHLIGGRSLTSTYDLSYAEKFGMFGPRRESLTSAIQYSLFGNGYWQVSPFLHKELISFTTKRTLIACVWRRIIKCSKTSIFQTHNSWGEMKDWLVYTKCLCQLLFIYVSHVRFCDYFSYWYSLR